MKTRRFISLLLLALYLFAVGGPAYASLSCRCVAAEPRSVEHVCCAGCAHGADAAGAAMQAPCCDDRHSTEVALYTGSSSDNGERPVRCAVLDLPDALAGECPCPRHIPSLRRPLGERPMPFIIAPPILPSGFRAPPVLV